MKRVASPKSPATGVATQIAVANKPRSTQLLCDGFGNGAIGPVREVINWSSSQSGRRARTPKDAETRADGLDWDLWLGPASERPLIAGLRALVWRGWSDRVRRLWATGDPTAR